MATSSSLREEFRAWTSDMSELIKSRLTLLVLLTAVTGFWMGMTPETPRILIFHTLLGTGMVAAGAAVLNELLEIKADALMRRTQNRPIPAGRIREQDALCIGILLAGLGLSYLVMIVNFSSAFLAAMTFFTYLCVYTPLKKISPINTLVGAIPGALPPVIGWVGSGQPLDGRAAALFSILFFWQMPHFLAIAWLYREDYARGGFHMLTLQDETGYRTASKSILYALALAPCALAPWWLGMAGLYYGIGSALCCLAYLAAAIHFRLAPGKSSARWLFLASILYLPVVLILLVADKTA